MTRRGRDTDTRGRDRQGRFAPSIQVNDPLADVRHRPGGPRRLPFKVPPGNPLPEATPYAVKQSELERQKIRRLARKSDEGARRVLDNDLQELRERMAECGLEFATTGDDPVKDNIERAKSYLEERRARRDPVKAWTETEFELAAAPLVGLWHRENTPRAIRARKRTRLAALAQAPPRRREYDPLAEFGRVAPGD